jgi:isoleucyl-tRNA synthetase
MQIQDNLKFDLELLRCAKFFGTLYNTYSFFSLYANIDGFKYEEAEIPVNERPEIDQWIISELNTLVKDVDGFTLITNLQKQLVLFLNLFKKTWVTGTFVCVEDASERGICAR